MPYRTARADQLCIDTTLGVGDDQEPTYRGDPKRQQAMLADRMVGIVERYSQRVSEDRRGLLEGHIVILKVSRRLLRVPAELHARII